MFIVVLFGARHFLSQFKISLSYNGLKRLSSVVLFLNSRQTNCEANDRIHSFNNVFAECEGGWSWLDPARANFNVLGHSSDK